MRSPRTTLLLFFVACADNADDLVPAMPVDAAQIDGGAIETFAFDQIFLGETDRAGGAPYDTAWKQYGYDLDGLITTDVSTNVCSLDPFALHTVQVDGEHGIDNAFGADILPMLEAAVVSELPSRDDTDSLRAGAWTLQIQTTGLASAGTSAMGLRAQMFVSASFDQGTPSFDSATDWPVAPAFLADKATLAGGALVQFPNAYVADGVFVSGMATQPLVVPLGTFGSFTPLTIHHGVITFRRAGDAIDGTIAGVIDPAELIDMLENLAGRISLSLCGSAFNGIEGQLLQARDIRSDGSNTPGQPCDAISVGIGFTARRVANPTKVGKDIDAPRPCDADASADSAQD